MSGRQPTVVCAGLSCLDHIWQVESFPPVSSRTYSRTYRIQGGGPAATAAVTIARLGGRARLWALHGDDPGGAYALAELERFGVDVSAVQVIAGASSWVSAVLVTPEGERYIFPYRGDGLVDAAPAARPEAADAVLVDFRHPRLCREAVEWARERDVPTVGDLGNARYWELSEDLDVVIASEECAAEVLGRADPEAALEAMRWRPEQHVGITLGSEGYLYDAGQGMRHLPALPVEVIDTTGAGDVFHGAFAFALASGWDPDRCAAYAQVTAALSCTGVGRSAIPEGSEVDRLLEQRSLRELRGLA